jgi:hypothetical protein
MTRRLAAALALLGTLGINVYTLAQFARARTSVPWADQWVAVQDVMRYRAGESLWTIVWTPYWGHRLVIPRLIFLADAHWLSFASLTWLTLLAQLVHIALLIVLACLLLGRKAPSLFVLAIAVIFNLMLSPFQMENFVWGMQTMFTLVLAAATAAFLCLSFDNLALSIAFGIIASLTMPNGILVWPVLVAQTLYLRRGRKVVVALAAAGAVVIGFYSWHYTRPTEFGMGLAGMIRHPIDAIQVLGLIIGVPFRLSLSMDMVVGILTLAITGYVFFRAAWPRAAEPRPFSTLFAVVLFSLLSLLSLVAGRLTPQALHVDTRDPLPSRYFTMICLFWASVGLLALYAFHSQRVRPLLLGAYGILFVALMFVSLQRQLSAADDWADFFLGADAVGGALILDAPDAAILSVLWPAPAERAERTRFLREQGLAMFHEPRASWPGRRVAELFPLSSDRCSGAVEKTLALDGASWRVLGWAWDLDTSNPPDDVLIADSNDVVVGLARGGLRHGYMPGLLLDPQPAPPHARFRRSEWLGYSRQAGDVRLYGVLRAAGKVCSIK